MHVIFGLRAIFSCLIVYILLASNIKIQRAESQAGF